MTKFVTEKGNWHFHKALPKTYYIGVDCSSRAIHAVIVNKREQLVAQGKWGSKSKDFSTRFLEIGRNFRSDVSIIDSNANVAVEAAIYIQNAASTIAIASVVASVRTLLDIRDVDAVLCDNRHWKKHIIGKGNCNKIAIKDFTINKWGDVFSEQDYSDAACIALWIKRKVEGELNEES